MGPGATLTISFDEAVTVGGDWVSLACGRSGLRRPGLGNIGVGGGAARYRLAPLARFVGGERCRLTIHRAGVVDRDGAATRLGADYTVRFAIGGGGTERGLTVYLPLIIWDGLE